ncbi:hypothetical protein SVIOM74S_06968 [Streptomyces violarus]
MATAVRPCEPHRPPPPVHRAPVAAEAREQCRPAPSGMESDRTSDDKEKRDVIRIPRRAAAMTAAVTTAVTAAFAVAWGWPGAVQAAPDPEPQRPSAGASPHLPDGWRITGSGGTEKLEWRSPGRVPMGGARIEFRGGGRLLGHPAAAADGRTLRLPLERWYVSGRRGKISRVEAAGRRLDAEGHGPRARTRPRRLFGRVASDGNPAREPLCTRSIPVIAESSVPSRRRVLPAVGAPAGAGHTGGDEGRGRGARPAPRAAGRWRSSCTDAMTPASTRKER